MPRIVLGLLSAALLIAFGWPSVASGGCDKDTDCKGARICENQVCVSPAAPRCEKDTDCEGDKLCEKEVCVEPQGKATPQVGGGAADRSRLQELLNTSVCGGAWASGKGKLRKAQVTEYGLKCMGATMSSYDFCDGGFDIRDSVWYCAGDSYKIAARTTHWTEMSYVDVLENTIAENNKFCVAINARKCITITNYRGVAEEVATLLSRVSGVPRRRP